MAESINQNTKNTNKESPKEEKKTLRKEFQEALENWQKAIIENKNIAEKTKVRDLLLFKLIENQSKFYSINKKIPIYNGYKEPQEANLTNEDLLYPAYAKILYEFNKRIGKPNEVTIEFLTNNYKHYGNTHKETVSFIIGRIKNSFLETLRQNNRFQKGNKKNPIISIDKDEEYDYTNNIRVNKEKIDSLLDDNIEYSFGNLPKILILLNRVLLNQLWCIKKPGPTQVTSYLLNYLIHNNNNSIFKELP